jgi:gluconolactonase
MRLSLVTTALLIAWLAPRHASAADESFDVRDKAEFAKIVPADAKVEKLAGGMTFTEGPCWFDDAQGGYLVFSDIPANQLKKWTAKDGLTVFRADSNYANGNTRDPEGRLVTCEHQARRVTRTEKDGAIAVLAERYQGKALNSPNDPVVKSDGTVWFTDPPYGLPKGQKQEQPGQYVFRLDPKTKELKAVATDFDKPNGLAFSPDEKKLYVADSDPKNNHIRVFDVAADGALSNGRLFCKIDKGAPDGIRVDAAGRVFSSAKDGVQIFSPAGETIGKILLPENCANLTFGGKGNDELFMTASKSLYRIKLATTGAQRR